MRRLLWKFRGLLEDISVVRPFDVMKFWDEVNGFQGDILFIYYIYVK